MSASQSFASSQSGHTRAMFASIMLGVDLLLAVINIVFLYPLIVLLGRAGNGEQISLAETAVNGTRLQTLGNIQTIAFIVSAIAILLWIHRAHANLAELGANGLVYSPNWAVGWFFIPFANLVRPFEVVREIWKASDPLVLDSYAWAKTPGSPLIIWWWLLYLGSNILVRLDNSMVDTTSASISQSTWAIWLLIIAEIGSTVAAGLLILIINGIEARQAEKSKQAPAVSSIPQSTAGPLPATAMVSAETFYRHGVSLYDNEDYEQAVDEFDQAIQLRPDYTEAYFNRGLAYYDLHNFDQAIANFTRGIGLSPDDAEAHFWRAKIYADIGDRAKALVDLQTAEELGLSADFSGEVIALKRKLK